MQLASTGENINYTKAKQIISQSKNKNLDAKFDEPVTEISSAKFNSSTSNETAKEDTRIIEQCQDFSPFSSIKKSSEEVINNSIYENKHFSSLIVYHRESIINASMSSNFTSEPEPDAIICEIATKIKNLTPEQLALVLVKSAKGGLSSDHLSFMITASDQILKKRQILEVFQS